MNESLSHYTKKEMTQALYKSGLRQGSVVFSHSNIGFFGIPAESRTSDGAFRTILDAFLEVLGAKGTLVVPTFTYSFCKNELFDVQRSPSTCGIFSERIRQLPEAHRSQDPLFSVVAIGAKARELTENVSLECFGPDSFWDRFFQHDGIICNLNCDEGSTFIHYVEKCLQVPYRADKLFQGTMVVEGVAGPRDAIFFCRDIHDARAFPNFEIFSEIAREKGISTCVPLGRGTVVALRANDTFQLIEKELLTDPWFLTNSSKRVSNTKPNAS